MDPYLSVNSTIENNKTAPSTKKENFLTNLVNVFEGRGLKYGCIAITVLLLIPTICITSIFAFKYLTRETKKTVSDTLPWNSQEKREDNEKKFNDPEEINKSVIVGKIEWKLLESKIVNEKLPGDSREDDYCKPGDGNKLMYVKYSVRNVDRAFVTVLKNQVDIYDSEETKYSSSSKTNKCLNLGTEATDKYAPDILKRDEKKEYEVLYEVPKDKKGFRMKVADLSTVGSEFDYILLDL